MMTETTAAPNTPAPTSLTPTSNPATSTGDERSASSLRTLIGVVMLGVLMMQLDLTMTNIATRTLVSQFHSTLSTVQWVGTGYLLAMATTIPLAGWALERFGARAVWMACIGSFLAGSLLCGIAWSPGSLIGFRVLQGLGAGMVLPIGQTVLVQAAGPQRLGRVMSALGIPAMLGPVLGPVLGGVLVDSLSWRWIFFVNVPVCLAAVALAVRSMPTERRATGSKLDWVGLLLLSPGCAAIVYGLAESGSSAGFGNARAVVALGVGAMLLVGFVVNALRTTQPIIDLRLLGERAFASASASMFASGLVLFGAMGALPLYYQIARGYSAEHAGLLLVPMGVGMGLALTLAGRLSNRVAPRTMALAGLVCATAGTLVYTQLSPTTSLLLLGAAQIFSGLGMGATLVPIMTAAYQGLRRDDVPRASSTIRIMQQLGGSFGSASLLVITQHQLGTHAHTAVGLATAFGGVFWWVVAFGVVMLIPVLFLPSKQT